MAQEEVMKKPYGFIIYRGYYSDDAQWDRYMAYLKLQTRQNLEAEGLLELYDRMDWKVISSPDMQDDEPEDTCERFNEWLESGEEEQDPNNYRYRACLLVNEACLECHDLFMEGKSLETDDLSTLFDHNGFTFAILVSKFADEGWVMVGSSYLMPRAGQTLMMDGEQQGWRELHRPEGTVSVDF